MLFLLFLSIFSRISDCKLGESYKSQNDTILQLYDNTSFALSEFDQIETNDSSIVGGYTVDSPETYPYIVSIMEVEIFTGIGFHSCAGSLIAPNVVLTAAHCVDYSAIRVVDTGRFSWKDDRKVEVFNIENIYKHPDFIGEFFLNDVALLELSGKAMADPAPLHLGENMVEVGDKITAIGWGLTSYKGYPSPDLQAVD